MTVVRDAKSPVRKRVLITTGARTSAHESQEEPAGPDGSTFSPHPSKAVALETICSLSPGVPVVGKQSSPR